MMKKIFFIMALLMALATTLAFSLKNNETSYNITTINSNNLRASMTCDRFPRVCRTVGSPGPDCCWKKCVNVMTDAQNCGQCGKRCRYGEVCCGGSCVNVMFDPRNCGWCKNKCEKGGSCQNGMCNYA